ncbi:MAG: GDSL-type esterase/lipase family protein [Opitutaceae bacterium]
MKTIAPLFCLFACACAAQTATAPQPSPTQPPMAAAVHSTIVPSDDNYKSHPGPNHQCEAQVAAMKGKPVDVIFIGDSITQNFINAPTERWPMAGKAVWDEHYANRNVLNFGVGADRTENVLWRFDHMDIKGFRPKVAVVMIGTNNTRNTPEQIAEGVKAVLKKTQDFFPGVKIILVSILPSARAKEKMAAANEIIRKLEDNRTIFYFDLASKMTPEGDGWKGIGRDHLHLMPEGYELWAAEMEPLLSRLLSG